MIEKFALFIEIDGKYHDERRDYDLRRTHRIYAATGFKVLRFTNEQVLSAPEQTLKQLQTEMARFARTGRHYPPP